MAADCLVWLARPSCKHPEAQKGTDRPQKTRKYRFNSFCMFVAVIDRIQAVYFLKPIFQELHEPWKCLNRANGPKSAWRTNWPTNQTHNPCCTITHGVNTQCPYQLHVATRTPNISMHTVTNQLPRYSTIHVPHVHYKWTIAHQWYMTHLAVTATHYQCNV